jgi:hypothetical protein
MAYSVISSGANQSVNQRSASVTVDTATGSPDIIWIIVVATDVFNTIPRPDR